MDKTNVLILFRTRINIDELAKINKSLEWLCMQFLDVAQPEGSWSLFWYSNPDGRRDYKHALKELGPYSRPQTQTNVGTPTTT